MRVAPSRFERVMPERRSLFCLLKLVRVFLLFEAPRLLAGLATGAGGCPAPHNPCCSEEDVAMRYDSSPLYRSTVGFDRVFDMLDQATRAEPMANWPPYNIEKQGEDQYRITMAVAGFSPEEIQLVQQETTLIITGQKHPEPEGVEVLHRARDPRLQAELRSRRSREGRGRQPRQRAPDHRAEARGSRGVEAAPDRDRLERWTEACWPGERSPDRPGRGGVSAEAPKSPTRGRQSPWGREMLVNLRGGRTNGCERSDPLGPQPQLGPEHGAKR